MPKDLTAVADDAEFAELLAMIEEARARAARAINLELVGLYWNVGAYVSERTRTEGWGNAVIARFSESVRRRFPGITGFSPVNIWRMRTFYDTYADREDLSALLKEVSWTNHTTILSGAKTEEAREFYLRLTAANGYSSRELERQVDSMLFERAAVSDINMRSLVERQPALAALRDSYVLEFLDLPTPHRESDLRRAIVINLRDFILEFGKDDWDAAESKLALLV